MKKHLEKNRFTFRPVLCGTKVKWILDHVEGAREKLKMVIYSSEQSIHG